MSSGKANQGTQPLGLCRVLRKVPEAIESFQDRAVTLLKDRHHAVMLSGVTLMLEICHIEPALIPVYREQVPTLCRILRGMMTSGFLAEYDVGGITNPFLQVKASGSFPQPLCALQKVIPLYREEPIWPEQCHSPEKGDRICFLVSDSLFHHGFALWRTVYFLEVFSQCPLAALISM